MFCKLLLIALVVYAIQAPVVEGNCSLYGGRCVKTKECSSKVYEMNCSEAGTICCPKVEVPEESRCRSKFGGECISNCPAKVVKNGALDCDEGLSCCAWLT